MFTLHFFPQHLRRSPHLQSPGFKSRWQRWVFHRHSRVSHNIRCFSMFLERIYRFYNAQVAPFFVSIVVQISKYWSKFKVVQVLSNLEFQIGIFYRYLGCRVRVPYTFGLICMYVLLGFTKVLNRIFEHKIMKCPKSKPLVDPLLFSNTDILL